MTDVPAQIVLALAAILTLGVTVGLTVIVLVTETGVHPVDGKDTVYVISYEPTAASDGVNAPLVVLKPFIAGVTM